MAQEIQKDRTQDEIATGTYQAVMFSSVWLHQFFTHAYGRSKRINRGFVNIRFNFQSLYWAGSFAFIVFVLLMLIKKILGGKDVFFLTSPVAMTIYIVAAAVTGWGLAGWSPMSKSTGEGMSDWLKLKMQTFFTDGRYRGARVQKNWVYTSARLKDGKPRKMLAKEYIGTVPALWVAPTDPKHPYNPFDPTTRADVKNTPLYILPRGKYVVHEHQAQNLH